MTIGNGSRTARGRGRQSRIAKKTPYERYQYVLRKQARRQEQMRQRSLLFRK